MLQHPARAIMHYTRVHILVCIHQRQALHHTTPLQHVEHTIMKHSLLHCSQYLLFIHHFSEPFSNSWQYHDVHVLSRKQTLPHSSSSSSSVASAIASAVGTASEAHDDQLHSLMQQEKESELQRVTKWNQGWLRGR